MNLIDKRIVITGASSGLGKALSILLSKNGAHVFLLAKTKKNLERVEKEIKKNGGKVSIFSCDIRNLAEVAKVVKEIGTPDILVNNAGIWTSNSLEQKNPQRRHDAFDVNALGTIQVTESFLPLFKEKNGGQIMNVISTSGFQDATQADNTFWKTYGATKWAITGYTNALQSELKKTHIKVTGFFPGGIDTPFYQNAGENYAHENWMMSTNDVADIIFFILTRPEDVQIEKMVVTKKH